MIDIIVDHDKHTRDVYSFTTINNNVIFVRFTSQEKPSGKRKWENIKLWDQYLKRDSNIPEPELPLRVRALALQEAQSEIQVLTWKEYKPLG